MLQTNLSFFITIVTRFLKALWSTSPNNPFWYDPTLNKLLMNPDPEHWIYRGIKYLNHLNTGPGLKPLVQLQEELTFLPLFYSIIIRCPYGTIWPAATPIISSSAGEITKKVRPR